MQPRRANDDRKTTEAPSGVGCHGSLGCDIGSRVSVTRGWLVSRPAANGLKTVLEYQQVGGTRYFDSAGYPGRTVGLAAH